MPGPTANEIVSLFLYGTTVPPSIAAAAGRRVAPLPKGRPPEQDTATNN